jgi:hypothetical protein
METWVAVITLLLAAGTVALLRAVAALRSSS